MSNIVKLSALGIVGGTCIAAAVFTIAKPALSKIVAVASSTSAAPQDISSIVAAAKSGAIINVPTGDHGPLVIDSMNFSSPVTIRADNASFESILIRGSANLIIEGGTVRGGPNVRYGISIDKASSLAIQDMIITGAIRGIVVNRSHKIDIKRNMLTGLRSDGINLAESREILVEANVCRNFNPIPSIYDNAGKLVKDGDHADCIQAWSRSTTAPVSDIVVRGNAMDGNLQGIFFGNHSRNGVNDGGFDRIMIENNRVNVSVPNAIMVKEGRWVTIRNNEVITIPGSRLKNGAGPVVKATIKLVDSINAVACNNEISAIPTGFGTERCR